jgi:hypothetical protein
MSNRTVLGFLRISLSSVCGWGFGLAHYRQRKDLMNTSEPAGRVIRHYQISTKGVFMNKNEFSAHAKLLSRRDLIRAATIAIGGSALLPKHGLAQSANLTPGTKPHTGVISSATSDSVFKRCHPPLQNEDGAGKYSNGDNDVVYPLVALWLMLTTEPWENCLDSERGNWQQGLFDELFAEFSHSHPDLKGQELENARTTLMKDFGVMCREAKKKKKAFTSVRSAWINLTNKGVGFYGTRPCPGGGGILDVAGLTPKKRR